MNVKVHIDRAAAIKAGSARYGDVVVQVDPAALTQEQREVLASLDERGGITDLTSQLYNHANDMPPRPCLSGPDPAAWIDWHIASREVAKSLKEAALAKAKAEADRYVDWAGTRPLDEWVTLAYSEWRATYPKSDDRNIQAPPQYSRRDYPTEVIESVHERLAELYDLGRAEAQRRNEQSKQRREAAEAVMVAAEQRKAEQIANWVRDHMDDNAQGRFKLGLLPTDEVLASLREHVFADLAPFPRYQRIDSDDIDHLDGCSEYGDPGMSCETEAAESLTAEQFTVMASIRESAPEGATVEARVHTCCCDDCEAGIVRFSALVTVPFGELTFSREYSLDAD